MKYLILYLPVDRELEDGCMAVNQQGEAVRYAIGMITSTLRPADPFVVVDEYNQRRVIGRISGREMRWLKNGQEIPSRCVTPSLGGEVIITCPTCGASQH